MFFLSTKITWTYRGRCKKRKYPVIDSCVCGVLNHIHKDQTRWKLSSINLTEYICYCFTKLCFSVGFTHLAFGVICLRFGTSWGRDNTKHPRPSGSFFLSVSTIRCLHELWLQSNYQDASKRFPKYCFIFIFVHVVNCVFFIVNMWLTRNQMSFYESPIFAHFIEKVVGWK